MKLKKHKSILTLSALIMLVAFSTIQAQSVVTGSSGQNGLTLQLNSNPGGANSPYILFDAKNGGAGSIFMMRQETNTLSLNSYTSKWQNRKDVMTFTNTGRVGINTASPTIELDVRGKAHFRSGALDIAFSTPSGRNGIIFDSDNGDNYSRLDIFNVPNATESSRYFSLKYNSDSHGITIRKGGSVGIGTNAPGSYKLAVNGKVRAKEVVVETGWADFVFEEDYNLPTLEEVENHIKENGHLKDIPSAKQVAKNGVSLGQMDSKLLQKIEELTLYLLEEHKKRKQLEDIIKTLESRLNALETK
ncbi:hypothetical protein [uncultured Aquimarina sp.]|uniref:hypothetical protein n=1 Tax=uncultured Aquimarina sp. TaxID=575652 RepID=UPI00263140B1|nr:hypothetical protein [uncultured Aquimarina sp.]